MKSKKSIIFISYKDIQDQDGISNKILSQVKAFKENGCKIELAYVHKYKKICEYIVGNNILGNKKYSNYTLYKLFYHYPLFYEYIKKNKYDYMYLRYDANTSFGLLFFLLQIKMLGIKIILEIPTYPYDRELKLKEKGVKASFPFYIEKLLRHLLFLFIHKIITFSDDKYIWKIPCINISNGYNPDNIKEKNTNYQDNTSFNMIAVARVQFWHGFDRIIKGIKKYLDNNPKEKIHLSIVGDGDLDELKELVKKYKLNEYISFTGHLSGEKLDEEFERAQIAIGSLGRHRSGLKAMKSLKNVEYSARGIPFIYSEDNSDFDKCPFILKVSADDSPINIENIISFYKSLKYTPCEISRYSKKYSWTEQMKIVLKNL